VHNLDRVSIVLTRLTLCIYVMHNLERVSRVATRSTLSTSQLDAHCARRPYVPNPAGLAAIAGSLDFPRSLLGCLELALDQVEPR
jgi:hypothetical protein